MASMMVIADRLKNGETVTFRPHGHSMTPHIKDGQKITVRPARPKEQFKVGMIVLVKVKGRIYLHFVKEIHGYRLLIGNVHGHVNGWTDVRNVFGVYDQE